MMKAWILLLLIGLAKSQLDDASSEESDGESSESNEESGESDERSGERKCGKNGAVRFPPVKTALGMKCQLECIEKGCADKLPTDARDVCIARVNDCHDCIEKCTPQRPQPNFPTIPETLPAAMKQRWEAYYASIKERMAARQKQREEKKGAMKDRKLAINCDGCPMNRFRQECKLEQRLAAVNAAAAATGNGRRVRPDRCAIATCVEAKVTAEAKCIRIQQSVVDRKEKACANARQ